MKKILSILIACIGIVAVGFAQQPAKNSLAPQRSVSVQEANQMNGSAQPTMQDGKPYSQWVAERREMMQKVNQQTQRVVVNNQAVDVTTTSSTMKPVQNSNQVKPADDQVSASKTPVIVESKPVAEKTQTTVVKPEVPDQFKLPSNQPAWDGKPVADKTAQVNTQTERPKLPEVKIVKEEPVQKVVNSPAVTSGNTQPSSTETPAAKKEN